MPSGVCVRIKSRWWVDLFIDGIPEDHSQISGLCGNFNEDWNDDVVRKDTGSTSECSSYSPAECYETWRLVF